MFRSGLPAPFLAIFSMMILDSCVGYEKKNEPKADPSFVYFDYMVWGDEESGLVTVKLQYRRGGRNGDSFLPKDPARVEFDGEVIRPDSAGLNGAYYEVIRWAGEFGGSHRILFIDIDGNKYMKEFDFPVLSFKTEFPATVPRKDLFFELDGLSSGDRLRILLTDTSFYGRGIERIDTVENGRIFISRDELAVLRSGPVYLEVVREEDIPLMEGQKRGGKLSLYYTLKREFILEDSVTTNSAAINRQGYPQRGLF